LAVDMVDAASAIHALNSVFSDPARLARVSEEEMKRMEAPLDHACIWGPGRA